MMQRFYIISSISISVLLLFAFESKLPSFMVGLLAPGFLLAMLLNGSLHDHVMKGYFLVGILADCVFYSGLALLAMRLFRKPTISK